MNRFRIPLNGLAPRDGKWASPPAGRGSGYSGVPSSYLGPAPPPLLSLTQSRVEGKYKLALCRDKDRETEGIPDAAESRGQVQTCPLPKPGRDNVVIPDAAESRGQVQTCPLPKPGRDNVVIPDAAESRGQVQTCPLPKPGRDNVVIPDAA